MAPHQIRPIRVEGNLAYVPLTRGYEAVIDAADVPLVDGFNWAARVEVHRDGTVRSVYAARKSKSKHITMHRQLLGSADGVSVCDHRDGDGLNNRRSNLRSATVAQNNHNQRRGRNNTSGVKGVTWNKTTGKWLARIKKSKKSYHLGLFSKLSDAAEAYAKASAELHGEFGRVA